MGEGGQDNRIINRKKGGREEGKALDRSPGTQEM